MITKKKDYKRHTCKDDIPSILYPDLELYYIYNGHICIHNTDRLPACVCKYGAVMLADHLLPIFCASLCLSIYLKTWKQSHMVVLCKPGKPNYSIAKVYCPIALLKIANKILSASVAECLKTLADKHKWLPDHHFGGRPGCSTTDALHLFVKTIKDVWARGQVASALFLDIKGAFLHALPSQLAGNMRRLGVPMVYIKWLLLKLDGHTTCLAFDNFESEQLPIQNGIDPGCLLSVIFYLFYW
jgi:hypothetical protein